VIKFNSLRHNKLFKELLFGVDFSQKRQLNIRKYHIPSMGLSELPFNNEVYKVLGVFNCEPFVKDNLPLSPYQIYHLKQLMLIKKIKLKNVRTKIGLNNETRLFMFMKNSQLL